LACGQKAWAQGCACSGVGAARGLGLSSPARGFAFVASGFSHTWRLEGVSAKGVEALRIAASWRGGHRPGYDSFSHPQFMGLGFRCRVKGLGTWL